MLLIFLYPPWHLLLLFWSCHKVVDGMVLYVSLGTDIGPFAHALWLFVCLLGKTLPAFVAVLFAYLLGCESIHYVLYIFNILLEKEILSRLMGNCDSVWVWSAWKCMCYFVYTFLYKTMEKLYNLNSVILSCTMIIWDSASNQARLSNTLTFLSLPKLGLYKAQIPCTASLVWEPTGSSSRSPEIWEMETGLIFLFLRELVSLCLHRVNWPTS